MQGANFKTLSLRLCKCGKPRMKGRHKCESCLSLQVKQKQKEQRAKEKAREIMRRAKKKNKRENSLSRLTREADILFSQAIRLRDKKCRRTGSTQSLQCAHIFSRSNKAVRWDMDNALTLSAGTHLYWAHKNPIEFTEWVKEQLGEKKYKELWIKAHAPFKLTADFIKERIQFYKNILSTPHS